MKLKLFGQLVRKQATVQKLCESYNLEISGDTLVEKEEILEIPNQPSVDLTVGPRRGPVGRHTVQVIDLTPNYSPRTGSDFHDFSSLNRNGFKRKLSFFVDAKLIMLLRNKKQVDLKSDKLSEEQRLAQACVASNFHFTETFTCFDKPRISRDY